MTYFRIDFDAAGLALQPAQRDGFFAFLQRERPAAVLLLAHGWLNDREASGRMFAWFAEALRPLPVCGLAWPSHPLKRNTAGLVRAGIEAASYYVMKERAAEVGAGGAAPLVRSLKQLSPATRVVLAGHSFGARLAVAAAMALGRGQDGPWIDSMMLLQAAFSQFGFSPQGFFRPVVAERMVRGPIVVTHSVHDKAVGAAYPVASMLKGQNASGLGGPNDPYGVHRPESGRYGVAPKVPALSGDQSECRPGDPGAFGHLQGAGGRDAARAGGDGGESAVGGGCAARSAGAESPPAPS